MNLRVTIFVLSLFFFTHPEAGEIVFSYAPYTSVKGDIEEDDFVPNDDFTYLSLSPGTARSIRWIYDTEQEQIPNKFLFIEYLTIDTKGSNGEVNEDKYRSMLIGTGIKLHSSINTYSEFYFRGQMGAGFSRFNLDEVEHIPVADLSAEGGMLFSNLLTIGLGLKMQIIGYPGETMADAMLLNFNIGVKY